LDWLGWMLIETGREREKSMALERGGEVREVRWVDQKARACKPELETTDRMICGTVRVLVLVLVLGLSHAMAVAVLVRPVHGDF